MLDFLPNSLSSKRLGSLAMQDWRDQFERGEDKVLRANYRWGAFWALVFMLAGASLDLVVEPDFVWPFITMRVACAVLLGGVLAVLQINFSGASLACLGHVLAALPLIAILWMIDFTGGADSTYYAGLNLVLVGAALLLRWSARDSLINAGLCLAGYAWIAWRHSTDGRILFNNAYFLAVTAVFVVIGCWSGERQRLQEFLLREKAESTKRELEENNAKLKALDKAKTDFFSNVSHELRTPLTLILSPLEKLRQSPTLARDAHLKGLVDMLEDHSLRLLSLVNQLLELVRMDGSTAPILSQRNNLRFFIGSLVEAFRNAAENKGITLRHLFESDSGDDAFIDPEKIERIIVNLTINAIKFTPKGGNIDVETHIDGKNLRLVVRDNGAGISEEQQAVMFERFWQGDTSSRRRFGGVGIGLALVKSITTTLGGHIKVKSELGKGAEFTIDLPLQEGSDTPPPLSKRSAVQTDESDDEDFNRKALFSGVGETDDAVPAVDSAALVGRENYVAVIAEDEVSLRHHLSGAFDGFTMIEARDGEEALERIFEHMPDVVILDYMMPKKNGVEVTRCLRSNAATQRIPILVITASADDAPRKLALEAGVNEFITKPFSLVELTSRLRILVKQRRFETELAASKRALEIAHETLESNASRLIQAERLATLGRMSASIIHEVNNPLNYTRGALHALKDCADSVPSEERADFLEMLGDANEGVERVISTMNDLRGLTKGNTFKMEEVSLQKVVNTSRRLIKADLAGIEMKVDVPDHLVVYGNEIQLSQVFMNLIQNAASFVRAAEARGEMPRIEVTANAAEDGRVWVKVWDNGCGIAEADLERVFDPFYTRRESTEGTGLGLCITQQILTGHGARVEVTSEPDHHTEFSLCFPPLSSIIKEASLDLEAL